jgi:PAT family beta-lactamase induction signal transducer AmpG
VTYGWTTFFLLTFVIALPGVALLWWQRRRIEALDHSPANGPSSGGSTG